MYKNNVYNVLLLVHFLSLLKIANYLPLDEDLDYPAKLEQSAQKESDAMIVMPPTAIFALISSC